MIYELWDLDLGNQLANERSEATMAMVVQSLIARYGDAYAADLDLTVEDERGTVIDQIQGIALVRWADDVTTGALRPSGPVVRSSSD